MYADTAFMFVMGGLFTVKVLQSRHPDINAAAYITFFCFAVVILLTLMGIVSQTPQTCIFMASLPFYALINSLPCVIILTIMSFSLHASVF